MSTINQITQTYKNEYSTWRETKDINSAKRQEYLRRNPDKINDYDLQRAKILLNSVDMMDKSTSSKSEGADTVFDSLTSFGLGYAAVGGTALGLLISKLGFVKKGIEKITAKNPKSKNIVSMGITTLSGVLGILGAYPAYSFLSKIESKIHRKRKFETMEKELNDPKIFAVLDENQKKVFEKNLAEIEAQERKNSFTKEVKKDLKSIKQLTQEAIFYEKKQKEFAKKYERDISLQENELSEKEIKNAKKDRVLLLVMLREINTKAQSYTEKMQSITDNLITLSFALGSLFTLGYERIVKSLKLKSSSLPAGMGIFMLMGSTFFASWAQKRAGLVGRFKAKQDLMQNPEQLIYVSSKKTSTINYEDIEINTKQKSNSFKFLKEFFKNNKEYNEWKKTKGLSGKDISKAIENIELSPEQIQDGKRLQKNLFKTLYKVDKNTRNYSSQIDLMAESTKFPVALLFGSIGSVWGMKHLAKLRSAVKPQDVFKQSAKYIGTISLFTLPSLIVNSYFAKAQKMGARISDMMTMKELEDYRFFADYSKYVK